MMKYKVAASIALLLSLIALFVYINIGYLESSGPSQLVSDNSPQEQAEEDSSSQPQSESQAASAQSTSPQTSIPKAVIKSSAPTVKASQAATPVTTKTEAREQPPVSTPEAPSAQADVSSDGYGYSLLSQGEKAVYGQLLSGLDAMSSEIAVTPTPIDTFEKIYSYVIDDNPQLFWVDNSRYTYYYYDGDVNTIVQPFLISADQKDSMTSAVEARASAILSRVSGSMDDFQKALILHDSLADSVTYNASAPMMHNLYGALVNGNAVCDGYSRAYQYLCKKAGVDALIVKGTAQSGGTTGGHAWNLIRMNGEYYHIDLTWDDPDAASMPGYVSYSYFGLTTSQISTDHTINQNLSYPISSAAAVQCNYFVKEGLLFSTYNAAENDIEAEVRKANPSKEAYIQMKFSTSGAYSEASQNIGSDAYRIVAAINPSLGNKISKLGIYLDDGAQVAILVLYYS